MKWITVFLEIHSLWYKCVILNFVYSPNLNVWCVRHINLATNIIVNSEVIYCFCCCIKLQIHEVLFCAKVLLWWLNICFSQRMWWVIFLGFISQTFAVWSPRKIQESIFKDLAYINKKYMQLRAYMWLKSDLKTNDFLW